MFHIKDMLPITLDNYLCGTSRETCMGMGTAGIPRNLRHSRRKETNVAGLPRGWKDILRHSRRNVAVFDFIVHLHRQNEFTDHFFHMQNVGCLIKMITQIVTSASVNVEILLLSINKQFSGNGWGWV